MFLETSQTKQKIVDSSPYWAWRGKNQENIINNYKITQTQNKAGQPKNKTNIELIGEMLTSLDDDLKGIYLFLETELQKLKAN